MVYIIDACFHWIGFHMAQHLLTEGNEVIGIDPLEGKKQENLYFFIGRNSRFQHFHSVKEMERHCHNETIEAVVAIRDADRPGAENYGQLLVCENTEQLVNNQGTIIELPPLYGEWMPRNEEEVFIGEDLIPFRELMDKEEAVYIEDFIAFFFSRLTEQGVETGAETFRDGTKSREPNIRDLQSQLQEHYRQFRQLYED